MSLFNRIKKITKAQLNASKPKIKSMIDEDSAFSYSENIHSDDYNDKKPGIEEKYLANLECQPGSSFAEIKAAYKRLIKKYHPDIHSQDPKKQKIAQTIVTQLNEAFDYFECKYKKA